jgi:hypothetical protein
LKLELKTWNEEVFGKVERNMRSLLEELWISDVIEEGRALGAEEITKKTKVVSELESTFLMEEVSWRQKSRVLWLKGGE